MPRQEWSRSNSAFRARSRRGTKGGERSTDFRSRRCDRKCESAANAVASSDPRSSGPSIQAARRYAGTSSRTRGEQGPSLRLTTDQPASSSANGARPGCRLAKVTRTSKSHLRFARGALS